MDLQSDPELIERMLFLYFDHLNEDSDDSSEKTAFHKYLEDFRNRFLEDFNLLTKEEMSVENAFLWRIVAKYCKERNITIVVVTDTPTIPNEEIVNPGSQPVQQKTVETVDAIDTIVPDLPHYCRFLTVYVI